MNHSFWLTFRCFCVLSLLFSLLGGKSNKSNIILTYDFESENYRGVNRQYQDKTCSKSKSYIDNSLFQIVNAPGKRSGKVVKHHVQNCDERSEFVVPGEMLKAGQEYWIGWSMYIPKNYNQPGKESYTITQQMGFQNTCWINSSGSNCNNIIINPNGSSSPKIGSPINALLPSVNGTRLTYHLYDYIQTDSQGRHIFKKKIFTIPSSTEKWQDFVMYIKPSSDPKQARVKLWKDGKLYINQVARLLPPNVSSMAYWKMGVYVGEPGNGERIVYTDKLKVGNRNSSFNEVSP